MKLFFAKEQNEVSEDEEVSIIEPIQTPTINNSQMNQIKGYDEAVEPNEKMLVI